MKNNAKEKPLEGRLSPGSGLPKGVEVRYEAEKTKEGETGNKEFIWQGQ